MRSRVKFKVCGRLALTSNAYAFLGSREYTRAAFDVGLPFSQMFDSWRPAHAYPADGLYGEATGVASKTGHTQASKCAKCALVCRMVGVVS